MALFFLTCHHLLLHWMALFFLTCHHLLLQWMALFSPHLSPSFITVDGTIFPHLSPSFITVDGTIFPHLSPSFIVVDGTIFPHPSPSFLAIDSTIFRYLSPCFIAVDGGWSDFGPWELCAHMGDSRLGDSCYCRQRTCTNPPPQFSGKQCKGITTEVANCTSKCRRVLFLCLAHNAATSLNSRKHKHCMCASVKIYVRFHCECWQATCKRNIELVAILNTLW